MNYTRVIPRDLFNEAKLLKCLGQLCLMIHEGKAGKLEFHHNGDEFTIDQRPDDAALVCTNVDFSFNDYPLNFYSPYNCKDSYPLLMMAEDWVEIEVFNDDGSFSNEFKRTLAIES